MYREALLKKSISEFKDNVNNCLLFETETYTTTSGYRYIIKKGKGTSISAAIHYNATLQTEDFIGRFECNDVTINTRQEMPLGSVLEYKGLVFAVVSQGNYNESMAQWHYNATSAVSFIQSKFYVTDKKSICDEIGFNSLSIWLQMDFGVPVVPSHYAVDSLNKFIMVDVKASEIVTPVIRDSEKIYQHRKDSVLFSFVNMSRLEVLQALEILQEKSIEKNTNYGLNSLPALANESFYQKSFNWKSLSHTGIFDVNYYLSGSDGADYKVIKEALIKSITRI